MKLKLDENLPPEAREILREAGHDARPPLFSPGGTAASSPGRKPRVGDAPIPSPRGALNLGGREPGARAPGYALSSLRD